MRIFIISLLVIISPDCFSQSVEKLAQDGSKDLIGIWENVQYMYYYGYRIKQIKFSSFGKLSYNPALEKADSKEFIGTYEATSDSLKIKFFEKSIFEFYKYQIINDSLYLKKIETYVDDKYLLNNDNEENFWQKVYYPGFDYEEIY